MAKTQELTGLQKLAKWWDGIQGSMKVALWGTRVANLMVKHFTNFLEEASELPSPLGDKPEA